MELKNRKSAKPSRVGLAQEVADGFGRGEPAGGHRHDKDDRHERTRDERTDTQRAPSRKEHGQHARDERGAQPSAAHRDPPPSRAETTPRRTGTAQPPRRKNECLPPDEAGSARFCAPSAPRRQRRQNVAGELERIGDDTTGR